MPHTNFLFLLENKCDNKAHDLWHMWILFGSPSLLFKAFYWPISSQDSLRRIKIRVNESRRIGPKKGSNEQTNLWWGVRLLSKSYEPWPIILTILRAAYSNCFSSPACRLSRFFIFLTSIEERKKDQNGFITTCLPGTSGGLSRCQKEDTVVNHSP